MWGGPARVCGRMRLGYRCGPCRRSRDRMIVGQGCAHAHCSSYGRVRMRHRRAESAAVIRMGRRLYRMTTCLANRVGAFMDLSPCYAQSYPPDVDNCICYPQSYPLNVDNSTFCPHDVTRACRAGKRRLNMTCEQAVRDGDECRVRLPRHAVREMALCIFRQISSTGKAPIYTQVLWQQKKRIGEGRARNQVARMCRATRGRRGATPCSTACSARRRGGDGRCSAAC